MRGINRNAQSSCAENRSKDHISVVINTRTTATTTFGKFGIELLLLPLVDDSEVVDGNEVPVEVWPSVVSGDVDDATL